MYYSVVKCWAWQKHLRRWLRVQGLSMRDEGYLGKGKNSTDSKWSEDRKKNDNAEWLPNIKQTAAETIRRNSINNNNWNIMLSWRSTFHETLNYFSAWRNWALENNSSIYTYCCGLQFRWITPALKVLLKLKFCHEDADYLLVGALFWL